MRIPAIRAHMGIWYYYVSTLSFSEIDKYVKKVDQELHDSKALSDMIQRSITDNYKRIKILSQTPWKLKMTAPNNTDRMRLWNQTIK